MTMSADNPVRLIEAFVDGLDLQAAGFVQAAAKETGRPGYDQPTFRPCGLLGLNEAADAAFGARICA